MQFPLSILFSCLFLFLCNVNSKPLETAEASTNGIKTSPQNSGIESLKQESLKNIDNDNVRKTAKQGDDDDDSDSGASATNTAAGTATNTAAANTPTAVQQIVNAVVVPASQVVASSVLKAIVSPFEWVGQYVNPSTTTQKPPKTKATPEPPRKLEGQITYVVISPDEQAPAAPAAVASKPAPVAVAPARATSPPASKTEDDEEEDEFA